MPIPFSFYTCQNLEKRLPPPFRSFERETLARAQGWIAAGGLVYDAMRTRGYPAERGRVLALAVDTAVFEPLDESRRASVQGKLGLRPPVIGYTGRLTQEKGLYVLMRAMEQVGERPWSLLLLGSGPEEEKVRDWAKGGVGLTECGSCWPGMTRCRRTWELWTCWWRRARRRGTGRSSSAGC